MSDSLVSRARAACEAGMGHAAAAGYAGHNKHDALNSPLLGRLTLGSRLLRLVYTQAVMRAPINVRGLLGIPRTKNPKGLALFAMAALDLFSATGEERWRQEAEALLTRLRDLAVHDFPGVSWGYPYPWQDVGFHAPRHFPNRVVTAFVGQAFLAAHEQFGREQDLETCRQICRFLLESPGRLQDDDEMLCLSYVPDPRVSWVVMDVSILVAAVAARTAGVTGETALMSDAGRLARYVVDKQTEQAAWFYSHPPGDSHITHDNYHTGFILDALRDYITASGDTRFVGAYDRGLEFYARELFMDDGAPKWTSDRRLPHDVHGSGQGLLTFAAAAARDPRWWPLAERIAGWALDQLYDGRGRFHYQKRRWYTKRFTLLRWCNGWMCRGLAALCRFQAAATEHGGRTSRTSAPATASPLATSRIDP